MGLIFHYSPEDDNPKWAKHFFRVLACISDSYLRLTTAHTQILTNGQNIEKDDQEISKNVFCVLE